MYWDADLSVFYQIDGDRLYRIDDNGDKETVDRDVYGIINMETDSGRIYYTKESVLQIPYYDLIWYDDPDMPDYLRNARENGALKLPSYDLYYCDKNGEPVLDMEDLYRVEYSNGIGDYLLYYAYPQVDRICADWDYLAANQLYDTRDWDVLFTGRIPDQVGVRVKKGNNIMSIGQNDYDIEGTAYDSETDTLYVFFKGMAALGGIYEFHEEGKELVKSTAANGLDYVVMVGATKHGVYYYKWNDYNERELYLNNTKVTSDTLYSYEFMENGQMAALLYDSFLDTADAYILTGAAGELIQRDVLIVDIAEDGTAVMLLNYNPNRGAGDLVYYDGKETHTLDSGVSAYVGRKGSAILNY